MTRWLWQSKLGPVGERLQGVRLPLTIYSTEGLAGSLQTVAGLAPLRDSVKGLLYRVGSWTNRSESELCKKVE